MSRSLTLDAKTQQLDFSFSIPDEQMRLLTADSATLGYHGGCLGSNSHRWNFFSHHAAEAAKPMLRASYLHQVTMGF